LKKDSWESVSDSWIAGNEKRGNSQNNACLLSDSNQPADKRVPTFKQPASHKSIWGASAPLFYVLQSVNGVRHFGWNPDNFIDILPDLEPYIYCRLLFS
jgi:hypothetical protein